MATRPTILALPALYVCGVVPHPAAGVGIILKSRGRSAPGCFGKDLLQGGSGQPPPAPRLQGE
ncbi:MAG: hypothetical protein MUC53_09615 [Candidatus Contendobacter sp.]|nr:hypothetical protein [Candidatus Contendobacter sp.]